MGSEGEVLPAVAVVIGSHPTAKTVLGANSLINHVAFSCEPLPKRLKLAVADHSVDCF